MHMAKRGAAGFYAAVLLGAALVGAPQKPAERPPTRAEQERFIASTRASALAYSSRLPDFICTQTVQRSLNRGSGSPSFDTLTFETSYYRERETNRLTHRNGRPASDYARTAGMSSRGEFGANLARIFAPASEAKFRFEKWTSLRRRRAAVYSYRVGRDKAPYQLSTSEDGRPVFAVVGLLGELVIDAEDFSILRVTYNADDIPRGFPMRSTAITVDYEKASIGGKEYLLPSRAEGTARSPIGRASNQSVFANYRKFSADSVVEFGEQAPAQP